MANREKSEGTFEPVGIDFRPILVTAALLLAGCAGLPSVERAESHALPGAEATRLAKARDSILSTHPGESAFLPLVSGVDALLARIALAEVAERTLDAQYYIWRDDLTGRHFANALLRAADRGVRVRVLLDDVGASANDEVILALDAHPNIEIRLFNPVTTRTFRNLGMVGDFSRTNRRMHNKSFVADNHAAILGGRNIGDEYFEAGEVAFSDLDVLTFGPGVAAVSRAFDEFWNAPPSIPVAGLLARKGEGAELDKLRASLAAFIAGQRDSPYVKNAQPRMARMLAAGREGFSWGKAHVLHDDPAKVSRSRDDAAGHLLPQFSRLGIGLEREIMIVSPYFIPGDAGVAWMRGLVARGVRVTVLTNSLAATDVGMVHAGYSRYREALLEGGVRLYELKPSATREPKDKGDKPGFGSSRASLHAKTFFFDRKAVFIGSLNLDPRSIELNTEIGVVCESVALAEELSGKLEARLARVAWRLERVVDSSGRARLEWIETGDEGERRLAGEPEVSAWRLLSVWFLGLLPIESQL
jgi:putative cardiolipin synthase